MMLFLAILGFNSIDNRSVVGIGSTRLEACALLPTIDSLDAIDI